MIGLGTLSPRVRGCGKSLQSSTPSTGTLNRFAMSLISGTRDFHRNDALQHGGSQSGSTSRLSLIEEPNPTSSLSPNDERKPPSRFHLPLIDTRSTRIVRATLRTLVSAFHWMLGTTNDGHRFDHHPERISRFYIVFSHCGIRLSVFE